MSRFLNLFRWRRDRLDRDLERELRDHVDRRVGDMMRSGSSEPEARRQASIEFGGVAQIDEEVRDTWIWRWLDALMADLRYSVRGLVNRWGFALGAVAMLALAIGATIAMFSVVSTVLLQPLPYHDAERIVSIETFWTRTGRTSQDVSGPDFLDWQAQSDVTGPCWGTFEFSNEKGSWEGVWHGTFSFATGAGSYRLFGRGRGAFRGMTIEYEAVYPGYAFAETGPAAYVFSTVRSFRGF